MLKEEIDILPSEASSDSGSEELNHLVLSELINLLFLETSVGVSLDLDLLLSGSCGVHVNLLKIL